MLWDYDALTILEFPGLEIYNIFSKIQIKQWFFSSIITYIYKKRYTYVSVLCSLKIDSKCGWNAKLSFHEIDTAWDFA